MSKQRNKSNQRNNHQVTRQKATWKSYNYLEYISTDLSQIHKGAQLLCHITDLSAVIKCIKCSRRVDMVMFKGDTRYRNNSTPQVSQNLQTLSFVAFKEQQLTAAVNNF